MASVAPLAATKAVGAPTTILHPTDFCEESAEAFLHALALALASKGQLNLVHTSKDKASWHAYPHVRQTLLLWGLIDGSKPRADIERTLGIRVAKVDVQAPSPIEGLLQFLDRYPADLIVLATEGRDGPTRWTRGSVAERLLRRAARPTLFLRKGTTGFVDASTGRLSLRHVLIPVDHHPAPGPAVTAIMDLLGKFGVPTPVPHFVHIGGPPPEIRCHCNCSHRPILVRQGNAVDGILAAARELRVDVIAMPTAGHDGALDVLRGSTTERVLRHAPCPVLAMPSRQAD